MKANLTDADIKAAVIIQVYHLAALSTQETMDIVPYFQVSKSDLRKPTIFRKA